MSGKEASGIHGMPGPKLEALIEMMYLAAAADGEFSAVERSHFLANLQTLTDGRLLLPDLEALLAEAERALSKEGREARLESVKARLPDLGARRVALALAVRIMAADGVIRTSERELIVQTAQALELPPADAADLVKDLA